MGSTNVLRQMKQSFGYIVGFLVAKCPWARTQLPFISALCDPDMATLSVSLGLGQDGPVLRILWAGWTPGPLGHTGVFLR